MKTRNHFHSFLARPLWITCGASLMAATVMAGPVGFVQSTFNTDLDGWTATTNEISWTNTGGNPGGFIQFTDESTDTTKVIAPAKFLGDYSALNGQGCIEFDHKVITEVNANGFLPYQIWLSGPGGAATWTNAGPGTNATPWTTEAAPLLESAWKVTSGTWNSLMTNVNSFQIAMELVSNVHADPTSEDIEGIDNVRVLPPPTLVIQTTNAGAALVSWPSIYGGYLLQQNALPGTTNWVFSTNPTNVVGGNDQVSFGPAASPMFFRLSLP